MECGFTEKWRVIEGFPDYEVSNLGRVKSHRKGFPIIMSPSYTSHGYARILLCNDEGKFARSVHRLVAEAFLPKVDGKNVVNHKDSNPANNSLTNLEWCTQSENVIHAIKNGRVPKTRNKRTNTGEKYIRKYYLKSGGVTYIVRGGRHFNTLQDAIRHRDEVLGIG